MAQEIKYINDKHDKNKVYCIKRYADGHYYGNETINGKLFYKKWFRIRKSTVKMLEEE